MSSVIKFQCDFCLANSEEPFYVPVGTKRGMRVVICGACGLVQSIQTEPKPHERIQTLSCEADWGNVRHGKGLRLGRIEGALEGQVNWRQVKTVLDVGSNRGDFIRWVFSKNPELQITAVEPDQEITGSYKGLSGVCLLEGRFENIKLEKDFFDFIYCSHTLEHVPSASRMLQSIYDAAKPGALLFLEVPALEGLSDPYGVEEYFMDKHTFHFDRKVLSGFLERMGWRILKDRDPDDVLNISFLLKKGKPRKEFPVVNAAEENKRLLSAYQVKLPEHWKLLRKAVSERLAPLAKRQKIVYWGAGRIFDALFKYGNLTPADVHGLVDGHLWRVMDITHGISIQPPENIRLMEPHIVVVLARTSEDAIAKKAYAMGVRHVMKFSELLDQCRIEQV